MRVDSSTFLCVNEPGEHAPRQSGAYNVMSNLMTVLYLSRNAQLSRELLRGTATNTFGGQVNFPPQLLTMSMRDLLRILQRDRVARLSIRSLRYLRLSDQFPS